MHFPFPTLKSTDMRLSILRPVHQLMMLVLFFLVVASTFHKEVTPSAVKARLDSYFKESPLEKVYVHLDRRHYTLGDTAWFKVYLLDAQLHQPSPVSKLVYVELLSPSDEVIATRHILIDQGVGAGDFLLPKDWAAGEYVVRAYTQYMRNYDHAFFFRQTIRLWNAQSEIREGERTIPTADRKEDNGAGSLPALDFDLQFFPEGGDLVHGLSSAVAFKAIDETGSGAPVEGVVFDERDQLVAFVKSIEFGMGFFSITPQPGKTYRAEVMSNGRKKTFTLPPARPQGYVLKIKQRSDDQLDLEAAANLPQGLNGSFVVGHLRGQVFCTIQSPENVDRFTTAVPLTDLPDGLAHFTLFSPEGLPVCERLVFIDRPENECRLKTTIGKPGYGKREKAEIYLQLADNLAQPLSGHVSLAVTDLYTAPYAPYGEDIRTYLLLNSELRGYIENPAYFFEEESAGRRQLLHLLMMTHGWRRFNWEQVLGGELPELTFAPEWGFSLTGYTRRPGGKPLAADLALTSTDPPYFNEELTSNPDGRFEIHGLAFFDTTHFVLQANVSSEGRKKEKDRNKTQPGDNIVIHLDEQTLPDPARSYAQPLPLPGEDFIGELLRESRRIQTIDSAYRAEWSISLDEVTVRARSRKPSIFDASEKYYKAPDNRLVIDSFPSAVTRTSVLDFLRGMVPGLDIQGVFPTYQVRIRGNSTILGDNTPLFVLDGLPLGGAEAIDRILAIPMPEIAYVDVIKGLRVASFGQTNTGGVIAIYTRAGVGMPPSRPRSSAQGVRQYVRVGFYAPREFYSPAYEGPAEDALKPDYRTTLFWAPNVVLDENGRAMLSFYTSDKASSYRVVVEGMTADGRPVRAVERLDVSY